MKTKTIIITLLIASLLFSTGCWDYTEYENLAMVSLIGFDTDTTRQVTVTLAYLVPGGNYSQATNGGPKATTSTTVVKATGLSIADALSKIQQTTGKRLFYSYTDEVVIGENAAKLITKDIIGFIDRTPLIRKSAYLVITKGLAEKVLSTSDPNTSQTTGKNIHNLIDQSINTGSAFPVSLQDFEEEMSISGEEPVAPRVTVEDMDQSKNSSTSSDTSSDTSSSLSNVSTSSDFSDELTETGAVELGEPKKGYDKVDGIAAFQQGELVGWLDGKECTGLGWITNQKINPYETVKTSSEDNMMNTLIFRVSGSKCDIKIKFDNDKPVIYINAYVEADLRKYSTNIDLELLTPDVVSLLEKGLADNVRSDINDAIKKGQKELKTDIFCIGFNFYRQYPKLWHSQYEKEWKQIFPTLQIKVSVDAKVVDTGTAIKKFSAK